MHGGQLSWQSDISFSVTDHSVTPVGRLEQGNPERVAPRKIVVSHLENDESKLFFSVIPSQPCSGYGKIVQAI